MTDWDQAACHQPNVDPELWWKPNPQHADPWVQARNICLTCPIQPACLTEALARPEPDGMWGATSPDERRNVHTHILTRTNPGRADHSYVAYRTGRCRCHACTEANRRYQADLRRRLNVA